MVLTHENKDAGADVEKGGRPGHQEEDADDDKKMNCCTHDTAASHYNKNDCERLMIILMSRSLI